MMNDQRGMNESNLKYDNKHCHVTFSLPGRSKRLAMSFYRLAPHLERISN